MTYIDLDQCDYRARCYVNGTCRDADGKVTPLTGRWHARFDGHPWVMAAEAEGWGRELRSAIVQHLKARMHTQQKAFVWPQIEELMPDGNWIEYTRRQAEAYAIARQWQADRAGLNQPAAQPIHKLPDVTKHAFRRMQQRSRNPVHRESLLVAQRITGEHQE